MERPVSRASHGARTASRSSTSTNNTKTSMHTAHTSNSNPPGSPGPSHAHRFYHASCQRPSSATPRTVEGGSRLTTQASSESTRQPAMSAFLQEKLRESRQAESDRASTWSRSHSDANSSREFSRSLGSPIKSVEFDGHRSHSPATTETSKKKGMGVLDQEKVISSLHKKNFDLKLELYHRRERQTALEEKVEALEMEKSQAEETNRHLSQEVEKRDKAIEEAVAMIVSLEASLEQFAKERSIIDHIEAEGRYAGHNLNPCYEDPRPATRSPDTTRQGGGDKIINRMPSFMSDHSENTENLRNVYLGTRGSVLSLAQVPEGPGEGDHGRSPSLSVLSESSFVSVYGSKEDEDDEPTFNGSASLPPLASTIKRPKTAFVTHSSPTRSARSNSASARQAHFDSINNVIEYNSPRQRTERHHSSIKIGSRPQSRDQEGSERFTGRASMSPNHQRLKHEKMDSLRRVTTDAPGGVRLQDHNLPPTPDTISTSTLRRYQNSDDEAVPRPPTARPSYGALSEASENDGSGSFGTYSGVRLEQAPMRAVKASAQIIDLNNRVYRENQGRSIQRPRSADETTISNRRGNDWDSDTDESDVESLESSIDIWMRESSKPTKNKNGRASPDLFSFSPSAAANGGWAMDAMFGAGSGVQGGASTGLDPDRIKDLMPLQQELFSTNVAPSAPRRGSSLNAQAVQQSKTSFLSRPLANVKASKGGRKKGHQRRNSDDIQIRTGGHAHTKSEGQPAGDQKKNHYPPIVQQPTQNKFTKFFRRSSTGPPSGAPTPTPQTEHGPTEPPSNGFSSSNGASAPPPWISRTGATEEDRDSATPPPILRKSRQGRHISVDTDMANDTMMSQESTTPRTPRLSGSANERDTPDRTDSPRVGGATGSRRKWLPAFGLRNKQG
ncbi:uncharacterized protein FIESC28_02962 [Fusarium coffeatum]|uniref:Centrosomin N-terminal motif 1 domain-containing protein n=1 Tax=Fusarium coffeatum TaxID=231269 RepID=A0A366S4K0_9HYPO|nr:uncharacterized protein FIESC28_02962 [Fusarium coffeatum]RBR24229.1 hypothetical protein FIESC28_02962 [Fusarium coffeatum]